MDLLSIIEQGDHLLEPRALLAVYDNYIEIAQVRDQEISSFSPLTKDALVKLANISLSENNNSIIKGTIPKNVEYVSFSLANTIIVFREPAMKRLIYISGKQITLDVPKLIMVITNNRLKVYCYQNQLRKSTMLFKAPFSNSLSEEIVCFGTVKIKKHTTINSIVKEYKDAYWDSAFEMEEKGARKRILEAFKDEQKVMTYEKLIQGL